MRNPARERSRNPNREVWESPSVYGGEDVNYKELKNDGFVITAFLTSSCEKIIKRGILWQKSIS
ncbi:MAG: hypothetical protein GPJ27_10780 [Microcystis aeruginosa L111-01]|nr:hypothetical protein [Microcystis aeruginosa L111-01]